MPESTPFPASPSALAAATEIVASLGLHEVNILAFAKIIDRHAVTEFYRLSLSALLDEPLCSERYARLVQMETIDDDDARFCMAVEDGRKAVKIMEAAIAP